MTSSPPTPFSHGNGSNQNRVIDFLARPGTIDAGTPRVFRTHAAIVFVGAERAFKIKRAVRYPYLDFSTLERRRDACLREIEVNRAAAPRIYLGAVPIVERDGHVLAIGGPGAPIEWAVEMRTFAQSDLLAEMATAKALEPALLDDLADVVAAMHADAARRAGIDAPAKFRAIIEDVSAAAGASVPRELAPRIAVLREAALHCLERCQAHLERRAAAGFVRRCHGDLHLSNIVMWEGRPTPFDAIEFSDEIATVDTLYDLAFLLMDLDKRAGRAAANRVLNRYLWRSADAADLPGLATLPLFLGLRAAIRGLVAAEREALVAGSDREANHAAASEAEGYVESAIRYLNPPPPRLIAVGGLSGTGKSTLAAALCSAIPPAPGAVHLRSDLERKKLAGLEPTDRLPEESYTPEAAARVYAHLLECTAVILAAGHSVVVDAVFLRPEERADLEATARRAGVALEGLWLSAPEATLAQRVAARKGDASDATPDVVAFQAAIEPGEITWARIDASGTATATRTAAEAALAHDPRGD